VVGIHGAAIGAAVDMVCACDIRYCTADAYFVIQEVNVGMTADLGTLQRLPHLVPAGLARELAFTGRKLPAAEARESGFVTRVFADHDEMTAELRKIALEIAARSPMAVVGSKEMLNYARDHSVAAGLSHVAIWNAGMISAADMAEAAVAREEKRSARHEDLLG
jgi:enoyl-CoA hydratase